MPKTPKPEEAKLIAHLVTGLLSYVSEALVSHRALVQFLEEKGMIERQEFAAFLESYLAVHLEQTFEDLKAVILEEWDKRHSGANPDP